jgi:hypothetical protein
MAAFFLKTLFLWGLSSTLLAFLLPSALGAPRTTTLMPRVCVEDLVNLVTCLNSSTVNDAPGMSRINIVQRCE